MKRAEVGRAGGVCGEGHRGQKCCGLETRTLAHPAAEEQQHDEMRSRVRGWARLARPEFRLALTLLPKEIELPL